MNNKKPLGRPRKAPTMQICTRVDAEVGNAIIRFAEAQERSVSWVVAKFLTDWVDGKIGDKTTS